MFGKLIKFILDIFQVVIFAVSIFMFIYFLILQPHKIKGESMVPNFQDDEYLLTDKVTYRFVREPQRGDVIVFKAPPNDTDEYIKRIIGLPGDVILLKGGKVYINNELLVEAYLPEDQITKPGKFLLNNSPYTIPADSYMFFGDNRAHSLDSRAFGPITTDKITGRAFFVYWPPSEVGLIKK